MGKKVQGSERTYLHKVHGPHTDESLDRLFYWKIGAKDYERNIVSANRNFISRRQLLDTLPDDISAEAFLAQFPRGGPIYRIFWLHCCFPNRFPIYDQHVHRTMAYLKIGSADELEDFSAYRKIDVYLGEYLPFYATFSSLNFTFEPARDGVRGRKAGRALWWFGKCFKTPNRVLKNGIGEGEWKGETRSQKLEIGKAKRREISSRKMHVMVRRSHIRRPTGSSRKSVRDGEERAGAKREEEVGLLRSK